jgi:hypothetical protein
MKETKDNSLFTEVTSEESASVNGGHYYYNRYNCYRPARHVVYRRDFDGSLRVVYRYW